MPLFEQRFSDLENLLLLQSIRGGTFTASKIFADLPPAGVSPYAVICNSVPKSGTYLLTEMLKATGLWAGLGHHAYTRGLSRVRSDGVLETERKIPALQWLNALPNGYSCPAHVEYSPYIEDYLLSSPRHKMLFIIRDPRDLVISWVDFVYNSEAYRQMGPLNAYLREAGSTSFPTDEGRIGITIENLPKSGIGNFVPWIDSPACCTIRFEELYAALIGEGADASAGTVLERICGFLEIPRQHGASFAAALGRGLTASARAEKIDVYRRRMTAANLALLQHAEFQKLVLSFGYAATPDDLAAAMTAAMSIEATGNDGDNAAADRIALQREVDRCFAARDEAIAQQARLQGELTARIGERDAAWAERDEALAQQARLQAELTARIEERDAAWAARDEAIVQRQRLVAELAAMTHVLDTALSSGNR